MNSTLRGADFRAQRSQTKTGWLKRVGQFNIPFHLVLVFYQMMIVCWDLWFMCILTYKEFVLSFIYLIVPLPRKSLENEIIVIVGSSRGLGRELALKLGSMRASVICIDIEAPEHETTSKTVSRSGGSAFYFQCDITRKEQVEKTISKIEIKIGDITMLFHCCSLPSARSLLHSPSSDKQTIEVSITSYLYLLDSILPRMKINCKGHIVFLTSVAAISGFTQQLALCVSQFAIQGLYESVVEELRIAKLEKTIKTTLVHIYPFIVTENFKKDIRLRLPGFFGSIPANKAAVAIIDGVRKNKNEISIPKYFLFISRILKILPRSVTIMMRNFLDMGVDF